MADKSQILEKLIAFRQKNKFSTSAWQERGLNPSDNEMCNRLQNLFNGCTDNLIYEISNDNNKKQKIIVIKKWLNSIDSSQYDTEEREFICDYFDQLSKIVSVDIKDSLNKWLYGSFLYTLFKVFKFFKGEEKIIKTLSQDCTKCNAKLETYILKTKNGIPDYTWKIIQCNSCKEYNLQSTRENVKICRYGNYKMIEELQKSDFNEEQANIRLEQIKHFRK